MGAKCGKIDKEEERIRRQLFLQQSATSTTILDRYATISRTGTALSSASRPTSRISNKSPIPSSPQQIRRTQSTVLSPPELLEGSLGSAKEYEFRASNSSFYPLGITEIKGEDREKGFSDILVETGKGDSLKEGKRKFSSGFFESSGELSSGGGSRSESTSGGVTSAPAGFAAELFGKGFRQGEGAREERGSLDFPPGFWSLERDSTVPVTPPPRLRKRSEHGSSEFGAAGGGRAFWAPFEPDHTVPVNPPPRLKRRSEHGSSEFGGAGGEIAFWAPLEPDPTVSVTPPPRLRKRSEHGSSEFGVAGGEIAFWAPLEPDPTVSVTPPPRLRKRSEHGSSEFGVAGGEIAFWAPLEPDPTVSVTPPPRLRKRSEHGSSEFGVAGGEIAFWASERDSSSAAPVTPPPRLKRKRLGSNASSIASSSVVGGYKRLSSVGVFAEEEQGEEVKEPPKPVSRKKGKAMTVEKGEEQCVGGDVPVFVREMSDVAVKVGTRARLLVEVDPKLGGSGEEILKITWFRNEQKITIPADAPTSRIHQTSEGRFHYLDISPVITDDEGKWVCTAENFRGRSSCACQVKVMVPKSYRAPEFVEGLRAVLTEAGTVSLECKVIGTPTPLLKWYKDGVEIKAGDIFALRGDPSSLGVYTCEATNCMGSVTSSSRVHMNDPSSPHPPHIQVTHPLQDSRIRVGERLDLQLALSKHLDESYQVSWYNKSNLIAKSDRVIQRTEGNICALYLNPVEIQDDGEWVCEIGWGKEKIVANCTLSILVPRNYRRPKFLEDLKAILTEEGLVSFECKVCGFPTPILHWYKDGYELKPGDVYQLSGANSLGRYSCIAHNCMGDAESSTELTLEDIQHQLSDDERKQLMAEGLSSKRPPKFLTGLKSLEAKIGDPCELSVEVNEPNATIQWMRDGAVIEIDEKDNGKYSEKKERGCRTLIIRELEFEDQAEWKCSASNEYGHSMSCAGVKLIIPGGYKKPKFLESLRAVLSEEGTVNLECKVIGVPVPILKWYKDGVELKAGDIHRIISGADGTCCLGTYTCVAKNCMGEVSSSAALLGFEDKLEKEQQQQAEQQAQRQQQNLTRDPSLSTIMEERTSQMLSVYDTPPNVPKSIEEEDGARDISVSIDGKDVSVSLYETPDLTENDAKAIIEMFANEYSEYISEHNVIPLPSLRFVKETSTSGKIVMEAVLIDVTDDPFDTAKSASMGGVLREDPTEADYNDDEFSDSFESPMELSATSDVPEGVKGSRPGSFREKRKHSESSSRRSSEKKRKGGAGGAGGGGSIHSGDESSRGREVTPKELEMFGEQSGASVYLSAESDGIRRASVKSEIEAMSERLEALEEFERLMGEKILTGELLQGFEVGDPMQFSNVETLKERAAPGAAEFGAHRVLEGEQFMGLAGQDSPILFENIESLGSHSLRETVIDDIDIIPGQGIEEFTAVPYSNVGELFGEREQSLGNAEEVNVFGGERFIGIEMAEMVLEGADTFSEVDSLTIAAEKLESGSFGGAVETNVQEAQPGIVPPPRKKKAESKEKNGNVELMGMKVEEQVGDTADIKDLEEQVKLGEGKATKKIVKESIEKGQMQELSGVKIQESAKLGKSEITDSGRKAAEEKHELSRHETSVEPATMKTMEGPKKQTVEVSEEAAVKNITEETDHMQTDKLTRKSSRKGSVKDEHQSKPESAPDLKEAAVRETGEKVPTEVKNENVDDEKGAGRDEKRLSVAGDKTKAESVALQDVDDDQAKPVAVPRKTKMVKPGENVEKVDASVKQKELEATEKDAKVAKDEKGLQKVEKVMEEDVKSKGPENVQAKVEGKDQAETKGMENEHKLKNEAETRQQLKQNAEEKLEKEAIEIESKLKTGNEVKNSVEDANKEAKENTIEKKEKDKKENDVAVKAKKEAKEKVGKEADDKSETKTEAQEKVEKQAIEIDSKLNAEKEKMKIENTLESKEESKGKQDIEATENAQENIQEKARRQSKETSANKSKEEAKEKAEDKDVDVKTEEGAKKKEAKGKAEKEAKVKADEEATKKAEKEDIETDTKLKEDKQVNENEEKKVKEKAEKEDKEKAENEGKEKDVNLKAEKEAKDTAEKEAKEKAETEAKEKDVNLKAEKEAKEKDVKLKAEKEAKEKDVKLKAEKEAKVKTEKEAEEKAEKEAIEKAEKEAKEKDVELKSEKEAKDTAEKKSKEKEEKEAKEKADKEGEEKEAKLKSQKEAKDKAEKEAKEKTGQEGKEKAEKEAKEKSEKDAKLKAEKEAKEKAEKAAKEKDAEVKAEKEAKEKAEKEAKEKDTKLKAEKEAKEKAEKEAKERAEKEAKEKDAQLKAEKETKEKAEKEAKLKAEKEGKEKAEKEAKEKAEKEAKEKEAKLKAEKETKEKAEKEAKLKAEKEAKEKEAKLKAEKETKEKTEKEAKLKAEKEAKEKEAILKAEKEAKEKTEKEKDSKLKDEKEAKEKAETDAKLKAEEAKEKEAKEKDGKLKAEKEAKEKAEKEAKEKAEKESKEKEAKLKAEKEAKEKEAKLKAEKEAKEKAEKEAKEKEAKDKAEKEAKEKEAKLKAEKEAKEKAEKEAKDKEAKDKAEKEAKEKEAKLKAEKKAKEKAEKEAKDKEAKDKAEKEAKEKEAKLKAEKEAKEKAEKEAKEKEAKLKADKDAKEKAEKEAKEKDAKLKAEEEAKEKDAKPKAEAEKETAEKDAKVKKEKEAKEKAEKETKEKDAKLKAEKEAKEKSEKEAKEKDAKLKAEKEAKEKSEKQAKEKDAKLKAEREAKEKAEKEAKEKDAKLKAEEYTKEKDAKQKADKEAKEKAEKEAKEKDAKPKAEKEAKEKSEKDAKLKAEKEAKEKADKEAKEKDAKLKAEKEAKEKADKEAKEKDAKLKADKEAKEKDTKLKAEKEAKEKADKDAKAEKVAQEKESKLKAEKETKDKTRKDSKEESKLKFEKDAKESAEQEAKDNEAKLQVNQDPKDKKATAAAEEEAKLKSEGAKLKSEQNNKSTKIHPDGKDEKESSVDETKSTTESKRPSMEFKGVKKVNKIELQSLKLDGDGVKLQPGEQSGPGTPVETKELGSPKKEKESSSKRSSIDKKNGIEIGKIEEKSVKQDETSKGSMSPTEKSGMKDKSCSPGEEPSSPKAKSGSVKDKSKSSKEAGNAKSRSGSTSEPGSSKDEPDTQPNKPGSVKKDQASSRKVEPEQPIQDVNESAKKVKDDTAERKKSIVKRDSIKEESEKQSELVDSKGASTDKKKTSVKDKKGKDEGKAVKAMEKEVSSNDNTNAGQKTKSLQQDGQEPEKDHNVAPRKLSSDATETPSVEAVKRKTSKSSPSPKEVTPEKKKVSKEEQVSEYETKPDKFSTAETSETTTRKKASAKVDRIDNSQTLEAIKVGIDTTEGKLQGERDYSTQKVEGRAVESREYGVEKTYYSADVSAVQRTTDNAYHSPIYDRSTATRREIEAIRASPSSCERSSRTPTRVLDSHIRTAPHTSTSPNYYDHHYQPVREDSPSTYRYSKRSHDLQPYRLTERAKSYDHLPGYFYGQDTFSGESRGVVTCGGGGRSGRALTPGYSSRVSSAQNLISRTHHDTSFHTGQSKPLRSMEDLSLMDQTHQFSRELRQQQVKAMQRKWKSGWNQNEEGSLSALAELPTSEIATGGPAPPPRLKRRSNYQVKLSSEAEDIYGSVGKGDPAGSGLYSIPSYFTTPSVGYSYFSMASLSAAASQAVSGSFLALDEAHRMKRPRFSMKLQNRTTPENTEVVKFACTVFGTPEPTIQWYKNGLPIFSDRQKYTITSNCGVATLDIHNSERNDTGEYTCFARNFYGKAASTAILQVVGMDESGSTKGYISGDGSCVSALSVDKCIPVCFTTGIIETNFPEVNELVLECQVKGSPRPDVMWMKNGQTMITYGQTTYGRFRADFTSIFETGKCRLIIQRPRESDSGVYTCIGRNYDHSAVGRKLCWTDEVTKCVNVKGGGQTSPKAGLYSSILPANSSSFEYQAPRFISELESFKRVRVGEDIALTVEITGVPQPDVRWFHHKNTIYPIKSTQHTRIISEAPGVHTLYIPQTDPFDLGTYTVRVTNKYGMVESSCSVSELIIGINDSPTLSGIRAGRKPTGLLNVPPCFVVEPREFVVLRYGDDLVVECEIEGWPQVSVNLYRGCRNVTLQPRAYKELTPSAPASSTNTRQHVKFTLTNISCTDFGMYTVEAKNIVGVAKAFVNVKLLEGGHLTTSTRSTRSMTPGMYPCGLSPASSIASSGGRPFSAASSYHLPGSLTKLDHSSYPFSSSTRHHHPLRSISSRSLFYHQHQHNHSSLTNFYRSPVGSTFSLKKFSCSSHLLAKDY